MQPACSNAASADSVVSCKTEPNICFMRQAHSGLSFSRLTGDSSGVDYQDCCASPLLNLGDPPWGLPGPEARYPPLPAGAMLSCVTRRRRRHESKDQFFLFFVTVWCDLVLLSFSFLFKFHMIC